MKKIVCILLLAVAVIPQLFATDYPPNGAVLYEKQGGQFVWYTLSVRYDRVCTYRSFDPKTGFVYFHVICEGPGYEKCQRVPDNAIQHTTRPHVNHPAVLNVEDEIISYIDNQLVNMHNFHGTVTKKIEIMMNGHACIYAVMASWDNGNENGDATIVFSYQDITGSISIFR